jgi:hypothetical protein
MSILFLHACKTMCKNHPACAHRDALGGGVSYFDVVLLASDNAHIQESQEYDREWHACFHLLFCVPTGSWQHVFVGDFFSL